MSSDAHGQEAPVPVRCFVLTISDTRTAENDTSGDEVIAQLEAAGHAVIDRRIVPDDADLIGELISSLAGAVDAVVTTGGTGLAARDRTYEAIAGRLEKQLDGFGEIFRVLSFETIGAKAMLSRACAGTLQGTLIFCLPGSHAAVRLAMDRLIVPVLGHAVAMAKS